MLHGVVIIEKKIQGEKMWKSFLLKRILHLQLARRLTESHAKGFNATRVSIAQHEQQIHGETHTHT